MPETIHGHDVMQLIMDSPTPLSRAELGEVLRERYGAGATFHTCSASDLGAEALLAFLMERGKVFEVDGRLTTDPSKICDH